MEPRDRPHDTYEEYEKHAETQRSEWIDGAINDMAGSHANHGSVVVRLTTALAAHLPGEPCELFPETVEVHFFEGGQRIAALQPDLKVVCGQDKVRDGAIVGIPFAHRRGSLPEHIELRLHRQEESVSAAGRTGI